MSVRTSFPLDSGRLLSHISFVSTTENLGFNAGDYKKTISFLKKDRRSLYVIQWEVEGCCRSKRKQGNGKLKEITDRKNNSRSWLRCSCHRRFAVVVLLVTSSHMFFFSDTPACFLTRYRQIFNNSLETEPLEITRVHFVEIIDNFFPVIQQL